MQKKIMLNVIDAEKQEKVLYLDKNVSFEMTNKMCGDKEKYTFFYVNNQGGWYYKGNDCHLMNDIDEQITEIITNEKRITD